MPSTLSGHKDLVEAQCCLQQREASRNDLVEDARLSRRERTIGVGLRHDAADAADAAHLRGPAPVHVVGGTDEEPDPSAWQPVRRPSDLGRQEAVCIIGLGQKGHVRGGQPDGGPQCLQLRRGLGLVHLGVGDETDLRVLAERRQTTARLETSHVSRDGDREAPREEVVAELPAVDLAMPVQTAKVKEDPGRA